MSSRRAPRGRGRTRERAVELAPFSTGKPLRLGTRLAISWQPAQTRRYRRPGPPRALRAHRARVLEQPGRTDVAAEVGGVDRLAAQRLVELLGLAQRERLGQQRERLAHEPHLVRHARVQAPEPVVDDRGVVERELRQGVDRVPGGVAVGRALLRAASRAGRAPCRRSTAASRAGRASGSAYVRSCSRCTEPTPVFSRSLRSAVCPGVSEAPTNPPGSANIPRCGSSSRRASSTHRGPSSSVNTTGSAVRPIGAS